VPPANRNGISRPQFAAGKIGGGDAGRCVPAKQNMALFVLGVLFRDAFVNLGAHNLDARYADEYDPCSFLHLEMLC